MEIIRKNTVIVGSGAAGLNAADRLYSFGQKDIAVITEIK
jgi:succinate dehydrogenase/fumarate reductase flavoprotein subunit